MTNCTNISNLNNAYQLCNRTTRREIERFVIKYFFLFMAFIVIYEIGFQFVIQRRRQKWAKANDTEIINAWLDIIYMCDKYVWEITAMESGGKIRKNNISYDDVCLAIDYLSEYEEMQFWKYAKQMGLYDKMQDIIKNYKKNAPIITKIHIKY